MPNRILKESICTSEEIARLSRDAEVLFYRLIVQADDFGRLDARVAIVRARCYPWQLDRVSEEDVAGWLAELVEVGLVAVYQVQQRPYAELVTWRRHQQTRATHSKYPGPEAADRGVIADDSRCNQMIADDSRCTLYTKPESESLSESVSGTGSENGSENGSAAAPAVAGADYELELKMFADRIHLIASPVQAQEMADRLDELRQAGALGWWNLAIKTAEDNNVRKWSYVRGVIDRCLREGRPPGAAKAIGGGNGNGNAKSSRGNGRCLAATPADDEYRRLNDPASIAAQRAAWDSAGA